MNNYEPINMEAAIREIRDRIRRTETRVTKTAAHLGVDSGATKPVFENGTLQMPSRRASIEEMLAAVPQGWHPDDPIEVYVGKDRLMELFVSR